MMGKSEKMSNISTAVVYDHNTYPKTSPFDASMFYPEFSSALIANEENCIYSMVRQTFIDLEMDQVNVGTESWSPFREIVNPGDTVVIKPNLVINTCDPDIQHCTTTHPSVIRPIIDYCWKALKGYGKIIVGDCPGAEADFDKIVTCTGLDDMICKLQQRGIAVELKDFRAVRVVMENGIWVREQHNTKKAAEVQILDLGSESLFADSRYNNVKFRGAGYDIKATNRYHHASVHKYCVSKDIISADVVISVPKFKSHRKAGITCCLKNLVGINADKNYLPHFALGSTNMGGDEMPEISGNRVFLLRLYNWFREFILAYSWKILGKPAAALLRILHQKQTSKADSASKNKKLLDKQSKDVDLARFLHARIAQCPVAAGAWPGNETICRMILDLNHIFLCCGKDGILRDITDRKIFYVADAVEIGMGNGPTHPTPLNGGLIAAGWNGFALDTAILKLFGIDYHVIPLYQLAEKFDWIHYNGSGIQLLNGQLLTGPLETLPKLVAPENWNYYPNTERGKSDESLPR